MPTDPDALILARMRHDDARAAAKDAARQQRLLRRRSRAVWRALWFDALESFRQQVPAMADRIGLVWSRDHAQLVLYANAPKDACKQFPLDFVWEEQHLISQTQGLLAWGSLIDDAVLWIRSHDTEPDLLWYSLERSLRPGIGDMTAPDTPIGDPQWTADLVTMCEHEWTAVRNPVRGFFGLPVVWFFILSLLAMSVFFVFVH